MPRFSVQIEPPNPYFRPVSHPTTTSGSSTQTIIPLDAPNPTEDTKGLSVPASPSGSGDVSGAIPGLHSPALSPISQSSPSFAHSTLARLSPFRSRDLFSSHAIRVGASREQVCADSASTLYAPRATTITRHEKVYTPDGYEDAPWMRANNAAGGDVQQRLHTAPAATNTHEPESKESSSELYLRTVWHENRHREAADQRLRRHMNQLVGEWSQQLARFEQEVTRKQEDSLYAKHHHIPRVQAARAATASFDYRSFLTDTMNPRDGHSAPSSDVVPEHWRGSAWSRVQLPPRAITKPIRDDNDPTIPLEDDEKPEVEVTTTTEMEIPEYDETPIPWNTTDAKAPEPKSTRRRRDPPDSTMMLERQQDPTNQQSAGPRRQDVSSRERRGKKAAAAAAAGAATTATSSTASGAPGIAPLTATSTTRAAPRSWRDRNKPAPAKPAMITPREKLPLHVGMSPLAPLKGPTPLEKRQASALPYTGQGEAATSFSPFRSPWDGSVMRALQAEQQLQQRQQQQQVASEQETSSSPIIPRLLVADASKLRRPVEVREHNQAHPYQPTPLPEPASHVYHSTATALSAGHIDATAHVIPSHISTRDDMHQCDRIKQRMASSGVPIARGTLERALVAPLMTLAPSPGGRDDFPAPFFGLPINPYATKEKKKKHRNKKSRAKSHK